MSIKPVGDARSHGSLPLHNEDALPEEVGSSVDFNPLISAIQTGKIDPSYANKVASHGCTIMSVSSEGGNYAPPSGEDYSGGGSRHSFRSDQLPSYGLQRDMNVHTGSSNPGITKLGSGGPQQSGGMSDKVPGTKSGAVISEKQYKAIQKYPHVVEALGGDKGDELVKDMLAKLNKMLAEKIGNNTRKFSKTASTCVADGKNIKQYFRAEDQSWLCVVTASGPFRGDEVFKYDHASDTTKVLRIREVMVKESNDEDGQESEEEQEPKVKLELIDVTGNFNVISDLGQVHDGDD